VFDWGRRDQTGCVTQPGREPRVGRERKLWHTSSYGEHRHDFGPPGMVKAYLHGTTVSRAIIICHAERCLPLQAQPVRHNPFEFVIVTHAGNADAEIQNRIQKKKKRRRRVLPCATTLTGPLKTLVGGLSVVHPLFSQIWKEGWVRIRSVHPLDYYFWKGGWVSAATARFGSVWLGSAPARPK
jgi:hypothetical protein